MRSLPDKCFQLAIADPPYGIRDAGGQTGGMGKLKNRIFTNGKIDRWDKAPSEEFFAELERVSVNRIIWGGNYFPLPPSRCFICWDKVQPWENFSQVEFAWTSFDGPAKLYRYDNRTGDKIHPVQKPIDLYAYLLQWFAKEGDRIFDPMMGSHRQQGVGGLQPRLGCPCADRGQMPRPRCCPHQGDTLCLGQIRRQGEGAAQTAYVRRNMQDQATQPQRYCLRAGEPHIDYGAGLGAHLHPPRIGLLGLCDDLRQAQCRPPIYRPSALVQQPFHLCQMSEV